MELSLLSIGLNLVLMILLGAVIYYSRRLSESIAIFRDSRKELRTLINDLTKNIDKAENAIKAMRRETDTSADDLHFMITKGKALSEELQYIQEAGDRLANRLETAVEKSSSANKARSQDYNQSREQKTTAASQNKKSPPSPMFNIIDRDHENNEEDHKIPDFLTEETDVPDNLKSQAERDLAMALQKQKKSKKG